MRRMCHERGVSAIVVLKRFAHSTLASGRLKGGSDRAARNAR